jgi:hypothetical protein
MVIPDTGNQEVQKYLFYRILIFKSIRMMFFGWLIFNTRKIIINIFSIFNLWKSVKAKGDARGGIVMVMDWTMVLSFTSG